jgi:septum site-determining protein MinC
MSSNAVPRPNIRFRGRSFMAFVLSPEPPVTAWLDRLDEMLAKSAGFFVGRPVILDVAAIELTRESLRAAVDALNARGIRILGLEGVDEALVDTTLPPVLTSGRPTNGIVMSPNAKAASRGAAPQRADAPEVPARPSSLLIQDPIRSGQSIVYLDGDVTVLGAVGSGAEIVAGGSIHVYGTLRGRALAGAKGNPSARIFALKNEAELVAIDSLYVVADDMAAALRSRSVQVWQDGGVIKLTALD